MGMSLGRSGCAHPVQRRKGRMVSSKQAGVTRIKRSAREQPDEDG